MTDRERDDPLQREVDRLFGCDCGKRRHGLGCLASMELEALELAERAFQLGQQSRDELLEAAKLTILHFERKLASGDFQGDDEHEAWTALQDAVAKAEALR